MIEKAAATPIRITKPRVITMASLAFCLVALLVAILAGSPYLFQGATLLGELATQVQATTGLVVTANDRGRFDLLPRPHIVIKNLHFADPSGSLTIDAAGLEGDVRLLPLLVGRLELGAATLVRPKLVIDLDGRPMKPDSMIGRALRAGPGSPSQSGRRLGTVSLIDGTAILQGRILGGTQSFDDVDVTVDWPDLGSAATLTGSFTTQKVATDLAIWLAQPYSLMRGEPSPLALRIQSTPLDLSANGDFNANGNAFHGRVSMRAPSLPRLLELAGVHVALPAPFANIVLNSDVTVGADRDGRPAMDLPTLALRLDGNDYEGTLSYQGGSSPALSGTLATEQLALAPFLSRAPRFLDAQRQWTLDPITMTPMNKIDLDLRVSATKMRLPPFTMDDVALAIMTRGDRTEVGMVEGKAYGGDMKGRVSIGVVEGGFNMRGAGSISDADAAALSWDGLGRQIATGSLTASVNFEATGNTMAALVGHLAGSFKGRVKDGELSTVDVGRGLRSIEGSRLDGMVTGLRGGRTPFRDLEVAIRVADGKAVIEDAAMVGSEAVVKAGGTADLTSRALDLHVSATPVPASKPPLALDLTGTLDKVIVSPRKLDPAPPSSGGRP